MRSISRGLIDLEELMLACRTPRAEAYIREAVNCYKAGAYRSCIVATWVAVAYDIIDKMRDLALQEDGEAKQQVKEFDDIIEKGDIRRSLIFEDELLDLAKDDFDLLSPIEYEDLKRIRADRHRCAHPSSLPGDEVYQPSPETARAHMRNAVEHLLSREPLQGKAAQNRVMRDISSEYFPTDQEKAVVRLKGGPLANARESLLRSVVDLVLKEALLFLDRYNESKEILIRGVVLKALQEVAPVHPVRDIVVEKTVKVLSRVEDKEIGRLIFLCGGLDYLWESLGDKQQRVIDYLNRIDVEPSADDDTVWRPLKNVHPDLLFALKVDGLRDLALERIQKASPEVLSEVVEKLPEGKEVSRLSDLTDQVVKHYVESDSYFATREWGRLVIRLIDRFSVEDMKLLLSALWSNDQVYGAILGEESNREILERSVTMCDELADELDELYNFCREQDGPGIMEERADFIEDHCPDVVA
jgi:hypothetical protein